MNIRSFEHNYEVNAVVYDREFTRALRNDFLTDCNLSNELTFEAHLKRPWSDKLKEGLAKIFSPVL